MVGVCVLIYFVRLSIFFEIWIKDSIIPQLINEIMKINTPIPSVGNGAGYPPSDSSIKECAPNNEPIDDENDTD